MPLERTGFYDCAASIGRSATPPLTTLSVRELLQEMDRFGIEKALVHHAHSRDVSAAVGNRLLMDATADLPRLMPAWGVLPEDFGTTAHARAFEQRRAAARVKALRLFPSSVLHGIQLREWLVGPLLEGVARAGGVLFVAREEIDWDGLAALLTEPAVPVVLVNPGYRNDRQLFPLLERCPHLHLDASTYVGHRMIETFVRRFGSRRLILGTQMPHMDPGAILTVLAYADLDDADRRNICRDNLRRLLGEAA